MTPQEKFHTTIREMNAGMVEREDEVNLIACALLSGEHVMLVSEPGQGKSMLAELFVDWIGGADVFKYILNKFTEPSEILGPIDIPKLKLGDHRHITTGKLPEASIAFIDETFKGSSAILNVLLRILNERKFQNGLTDMACPLLTCIGASNEWGQEAKELGALFDRFLFRKEMMNVLSEENIQRLMFGDVGPVLTTSLSLEELKSAQVDIRQNIQWSPEAKEAAHKIRRMLLMEGIVVGDRRLRKTTMACAAQAWINGNSWVTTDDLEILAHIWWSDPETHPAKVREVISNIAIPSGMQAATHLSAANQIFNAVRMDDLASSIEAMEKLKEIATTMQGSGSKVDAVKERIKAMMQDIHTQNMQITGF